MVKKVIYEKECDIEIESPIFRRMEGWTDLILDKIGARNTMAYPELISNLVNFVILKWMVILIEEEPKIKIAFYNKHHKEAIGAIVAIVELLEVIGQGKSMPDKYIEMLKEISV